MSTRMLQPPLRSQTGAGTLLLLLAVGLGGCGTTYVWTHTAKTVEAFKKDKFECEDDAATFSAHMGKAGEAKVVEPRLRACMELRGYRQVPDDEVPAGSRAFGDQVSQAAAAAPVAAAAPILAKGLVGVDGSGLVMDWVAAGINSSAQTAVGNWFWAQLGFSGGQATTQQDFSQIMSQLNQIQSGITTIEQQNQQLLNAFYQWKDQSLGLSFQTAYGTNFLSNPQGTVGSIGVSQMWTDIANQVPGLAASGANIIALAQSNCSNTAVTNYFTAAQNPYQENAYNDAVWWANYAASGAPGPSANQWAQMASITSNFFNGFTQQTGQNLVALQNSYNFNYSQVQAQLWGNLQTAYNIEMVAGAFKLACPNIAGQINFAEGAQLNWSAASATNPAPVVQQLNGIYQAFFNGINNQVQGSQTAQGFYAPQTPVNLLATSIGLAFQQYFTQSCTPTNYTQTTMSGPSMNLFQATCNNQPVPVQLYIPVNNGTPLVTGLQFTGTPTGGFITPSSTPFPNSLGPVTPSLSTPYLSYEIVDGKTVPSTVAVGFAGPGLYLTQFTAWGGNTSKCPFSWGPPGQVTYGVGGSSSYSIQQGASANCYTSLTDVYYGLTPNGHWFAYEVQTFNGDGPPPEWFTSLACLNGDTSCTASNSTKSSSPPSISWTDGTQVQQQNGSQTSTQVNFGLVLTSPTNSGAAVRPRHEDVRGALGSPKRP